MIASRLLDRLEGVKQVGASRWRARCPAYDGRNRNVLSFGETTDSTLLIKCFHGCTAAEVVGAIRLGLHDLFLPVEWQCTSTHVAVGSIFPISRASTHRANRQRSPLILSNRAARFAANKSGALQGAAQIGVPQWLTLTQQNLPRQARP